MQGDFSVYGEITYQNIDDQRSKCSLCQRVIYKLLQKAHTTSHGPLLKIPQSEEKPNFKGIKKFSLQFDSPSSEPVKKISIDKPDNLLNFEQILKNPLPIELPQKHKNELPIKPCEKKAKSSMSYYIKQSKYCQNSLIRACLAYQRCCYLQIVKGYRKWKKIGRRL